VREETVDIGSLQLQSGTTLPHVEQRVTIYGEPNADASNVVLVTHALTGSSRAAEWWPGIVGEDSLFDPQRWCAIGVNALGGCYGSTGPASLAADGLPYGTRFPRVTVVDIVTAARRALEQLRIDRIGVVVGGSLGGMQALQWALDYPDLVKTAVMIGAHDHQSAMGIALNALQRDALALDPVRGLRLARKIAMLSYKSDDLLRRRHDRRPDRHGRKFFDVEGYLEHQADLFEPRMDAASYAVLTHAMDSFDVRHAERGAAQPGPSLYFIGITSDWLFRAQDVRAASRRFASLGFRAEYLELHSDHGHDAFLADPNALRTILEPKLQPGL
jgi:homoserine O-acetyltransferase/O-succinyltransferase